MFRTVRLRLMIHERKGYIKNIIYIYMCDSTVATDELLQKLRGPLWAVIVPERLAEISPVHAMPDRKNAQFSQCANNGS